MRFISRRLVLLAALLAFAAPAWSQVTLDTSGEANNGGGGLTTTVNLTVGSGTNRALTACAGFANVPGTITVTWAAQTLTLITGTTASSGSVTSSCYGIVAPTSGANTLTVTTANSVEAAAHVLAVTGANQTGGSTTFANGANATNNNAGPAAVTITSATNDMIMALFWNSAAGFTGAVQSGGTVIANDGAQTLQNTESEWAPGASPNVGATGTMGGTDLWLASGFDIVAAGGAAVTPTRTLLGVGP